MALVYFKPSFGPGGDGSQILPYDQVSDHTQAANDELYFSRGEIFSGAQINLTANGVSINAYGVGAPPKVTPLEHNPTWTGPDGNGEYYLTGITGYSLCLIEDGVRLAGIVNSAWSALSGPVAGTLSAGQFAYSSGTSRLYYKPTSGTPSAHDIYVSTSSATVGAIYGTARTDCSVRNIEAFGSTYNQSVIEFAGGSQRITVENNTVHSGWRGIQHTNCNTYSIKNNTIYDICWSAVGGRDPATTEPNGFIARNTIYNIARLSTDYGDGECIVLNPGSNNCIVEDNEIFNWGRSTAPTGAATMFFNAVVVDQASNNIVRRNYIHDGFCTAIWLQAGGTRVETGNQIYGNLIANINATTPTNAKGNGLRAEAFDGGGHTFVIYNNTFVNVNATVTTPGTHNNGVISFFTGVAGTPTINCTSYNNIMLNCSGDSLISIKRNGAPAVGTINLTTGYNCFYGQTTSRFGDIDGTNYASFATWAAVQTEAGSITSDPLLLPNYELAANSPCIGTGTNTGVHDYYDRPFSETGYDMGAVRASQGLLPSRFYQSTLSVSKLRMH